MKTTRFCTLLLILLGLAAAPIARAANIVWFSDNPAAAGFYPALSGTADDIFVTRLQAAGHNVIRYSSPDAQATLLTAAEITALNTNDLIIIGRSTGSGAFQAPQGHQWNTNITKPIIVQSSFLIRASRLGWFASESSFNGVPSPLTLVNPADPATAYLFQGVALSGSTTVDNYDEALDQNTSQTVDAPVAGARILATGFGTNNVLVEFPAGTVVKGGANVLAGYRIYFASATREPSGGTVPQAGKDNLTPMGEALFLRVVTLAINNGDSGLIGDAPAITTQPANLPACSGLPGSFSVVATGELPLTYQWYHSDGATFTNPVAGGTGATLTIPNVQATNAGFYAVVITNLNGSITSSVAALTIVGAGVVASVPASQTNCPGTAAAFTTTATGSGTITYTWRKGAAVVQGPDGNNSYTIASVVPGDAGAYSVTVSNDCNAVSNNFALTVVSAPTITAQPQNQNTPMGNGAVFSVTATGFGTAPNTYQWQTNGVDVTGATGTSLAISNLTLAANGMQVQVAVSNCAGGLLSSIATLTVTPIAGVSFDFNSPNQFTNQPYYMSYNDWLNSSFNTPPTIFEHPVGGVGPFPGSGGLDMIPNNGTANSSILIPLSYDFSLPGKTLKASAMVKIKNPVNNSINTQIGFVTSTNVDLDNAVGRIYMTVILQATAQPAPTFDIRTGSKTNTVNSFIQGNNAVAGSLTLSNWYRLNATFVNNSAVIPGTFRVTGTLENMGPLGTGTPVTVATISDVTITNSEIVVARNVYFVVRGLENVGAENRDNFFVSSASGPIAFVQQPGNQTAVQGDRAVFRALVDGDGPYTYQWSTNGVPIPGATSWKYVTPPTRSSDNGVQYTVTVTGPGNSVTSDPATLTVTADTLAVVSAGSVDGTTVGVKFNQPVDPATAENPANYTINGVAPVQARVYRTSLSPLGPDGIYVVLTPASVLSGAFTVIASGVRDLSGGTVGGANSAAGSVAGLTGSDVNAITGPPGENYSFGDGQFIVTAGGVDIWNNADSHRFVYKSQTGDFDVKTKVPYIDVVRGASKAGIQVRESLDAFSPEITAAVNPMWPGRNFSEGVNRATWNIPSTSWGVSPTYNFAWYPDAWLRFRRAGNTFLRYSSTNGVDWNFDGQISANPILPETLYFGLAVCAVANNNALSAQYENYGPFAGYSGATIAIASQPTNFTVAAGASFTDGVRATVSGGGIPASAGELVYVWQRNNGSGTFTNLVTAGATNNTIAIGPLFFPDNGAQFRVIVKAPGAADVISSTFTATVTDTAVPTISSVNGIYSSYPVTDVVVNFSELVSDITGTNIANYTVTNAAGVQLTVLNAVFLNGDRRTVVLTVNGPLGLGTASVGVSGVRDLNNNLLATAVRTFRSFAPATGPVVNEYYQDIGTVAGIHGLTGHGTYVGNQPSWMSYSNLFGHAVSGFGGSIFPGVNLANGNVAHDNFGLKAYTWFVPPTNGNYKFWIRADDFGQLWMNTNGPNLNPPVIISSSTNHPAAEAARNAFDDNVNTKYLNFDELNTGVQVGITTGATVVASIRFSTANDAAERDPLTFTIEGAASTDGPWTSIFSGDTGLLGVTARLTAGPIVPLANATPYNAYRVRFPTVRDTAVANSMQVSEIDLLDAAGVEVTGSGKVLIAELTGNNANYTVGTVPANSKTNISLVAGQTYYMEFLLKETGGGDGFSVMWTDPTVNTAPAATVFIPTANLAYPASVAPQTPVITEMYTGYQPAIAGNGNLPTLTSATNFPTGAVTDTFAVNAEIGILPNLKYIAGLPDMIGYQKFFATQPQLGNTRVDNYLGRMLTYFVAPSNGNYRFYLRADDAAQLYMNTNAANSTDAAGLRLIGRVDAFTSAYTLIGQNMSLVAGQRYLMMALWRDGGGGDGVALAVRSQGDAVVPPIFQYPETIPASMLEYPLAYGRAGAVNFTGILPGGPFVEGQSITLTPVGITGGMMSGAGNHVNGGPGYGFIWFRNGVRVLENSFTNVLPGPLTLADNGAVYTLVVTNQFSRAEHSITLNVAADTTAPTVVRCLGWRYGDGFTIEFSERLDPETAAFLGNYQVNNGLDLLSATLDVSGRMVSIRTSPQAPGTTYTVNINGVKDVSAAGNAAVAVTSFSTWSIGGRGIMVELFTNIVGGTIADLTGAPKFVANLPDVVYYTNNFFAGGNNSLGDSGRENYGARLTAYFVPTNTGFYRFYLRSDDASQLYMNINSSNSEDPAGRVMLIHQPNAGITFQDPRSISPPVLLNQGQNYYMEALFKEGTGGDYLIMTFRNTDANGTAVGVVPPVDTVAEIQGAGNFNGVPGNPDAIQIVSTPPTDLTVSENDLVTLSLVATIPPSMVLATSYQWQRFDGASFTNIPGATGPSYSFFAPLTDNNRQIRLLFSAPGRNAAYTTLMHVNSDTNGPYMVSAHSIDGFSIGILFNEPLALGPVIEAGNFYLDGDPNNTALTSASRTNSAREVVLTFASPLPKQFTLHADFMLDLATVPNTSNSTVSVTPQNFVSRDVGSPLPVAVGSFFSYTNGQIEIQAGGNDIWGTTDKGHMTLAPVTGDFDVHLRVDSLTPADPAQPSISKAGLMVRETFAPDSRTIYHSINPPPPRGRDLGEVGARTATAGGTALFAGSASYTPVGIPNAWVRAQRRGDTFTFFRSSDGVAWTQVASGVAVYSNTVFLGLATTAHTATEVAGLVTTAQYKDIYFPGAPTILVQPSPASLTVLPGSNVTYSVTASNPPNSGTLVYQWLKNGTNIPGATSDTLVLNNLTQSDTGAYSVTAGNDGGATSSTVVNLVVCDAPPVIVTCATNRTIVLHTNTQYTLADLRGELVVTACGTPTIAQSPPPGTVLNGGTTNVITFTVTDGLGSNATCQATIIVTVSQPTFIPGTADFTPPTGPFTAQFQTVNGVNYRVEYTDSLNAPVTWNLLTTIVGDGTIKTISDPGPLPPMRYYRIVPVP